jgi:hypothetical protein
MKKFEEYKNFVKLLAKAKTPSQRRAFLKYASRPEILTVGELFANFLSGFIKLPNPDLLSLFSKYKRLFRVIGFAGRKSWLKRKQAAVDLGKILSLFLTEVLKVLQ